MRTVQPALYSYLRSGTKCRLKGTNEFFVVTHYTYEHSKWGGYERIHFRPDNGGSGGMSDIWAEFDKRWEVLG